ncbi:MAG: HAMP domain-containing histidine kinase [Candidatus Andersenbacteria bacterium]|nr:HAMP domain-containing histidine kinase [Candidatus Andersenbacteria bacterium]
MQRTSRKLERIKDVLSETIEWGEALDTVFEIMAEAAACRKAVVLMWNDQRDAFVVAGGFNAGNLALSVASQHPLAVYIRSHPIPLLKSRLSRSTPPVVREAIDWLQVTALIPLVVRGQLVGLLLLDQAATTKIGRGAASFLQELAPSVATALYRSYLYQKSQAETASLRLELEEKMNELSRTSIQLKNLDRAKSEFLSIASHQLYTPLTALRGYISMLREGDYGAVPDKQRPILEILGKSATRLIDLIKNLLDISRIESGRLELNLEMVDLPEMSKEIVADLLPNAMHKELKLEFHEPKEPVHPVVADRERIRQVMLNFIDNAIKYTSSGRIDVRVKQVGRHISFAVKDTGKGIKQQDMAHLFNKFMRVGGASRFNTEGTGLGLYVARQIVKEHHGEVQVDSSGEGMGSTFSMLLPTAGSSESLRAGQKAEVTIQAAQLGRGNLAES